MKKIYFLFLSIFLANVANVYSQQDAQFSQNMFNRLAINPGYAGTSGAICGTFLGRQQWMGFEGSPQTFLLSVDAPIELLKGGVGMTIAQDQIGFEKTFMANLTYSYHQTLGPGKLGIGITAGILNKSINGNWVAIDDYTTDAAIPNQGVSDMVFDLGFGLYYTIEDKLYVGISSTHLPASTFKADGGTPPNNFDLNFDLTRHYYLLAGYNYPLPSNPMIEIQPSLFVKSDMASTQLDLNCNVMYDKTYWGGLSYRMTDAIVAMVGYRHKTGVKIGYAYDITTSPIRNHSSGSHEIMLGYCFNVSSPAKVQRYRNVRFL
jgi:type IX secretion system PorP/SprF family membrane protein